MTEFNRPDTKGYRAGDENVPPEVRERPVVREFDNTSLEEAVQQGYIGKTPESPADLQLTAEEKAAIIERRERAAHDGQTQPILTTETEIRKKKLWPRVVAGIGVVGVALTSYFVVKGGDNESSAAGPNNETSNSAVETPGEELTTVSLAGLETAATQEMIDEALQPVTGDVTPNQAIVDLTQRLNVYYNSGTINEENYSLNNVEETAESIELGNQLENVIFNQEYATDYLEANMKGFDINRTATANLRYSMEGAYQAVLAFNFSFVPETTRQVYDFPGLEDVPVFEITGTYTAQTNLEELYASGNVPDPNNDHWDKLDDSGTGTYMLALIDNTWKIIDAK